METGEPLDDLTELARKFCKKHGAEIKTVSEFLEKKDEKLMKAIQDGIDRYNNKATSRAQKVGVGALFPVVGCFLGRAVQNCYIIQILIYIVYVFIHNKRCYHESDLTKSVRFSDSKMVHS